MTEAWCPRCGRELEAGQRCPQHDETAALAPDPLLGRTIDGRFTLESVLGAGGMGTVYRASQRSLGRAVAVKILDARWARSAEVVRRFLREAHSLSRVSHPNVVAVHDYGHTDDGCSWIAMELVVGHTLAELIARTPGGLMPARVVALALELTAALEAAHTAGLVHRDLKPANVMLLDAPGGRDFVKVLDFGIARPITDATQMTETGKLVGTPHYLAPEVVEGEVPGPEADLYALGIILYELCTGGRPFEGSSSARVMYAHVHEAPPPLPPAVPRALAALILRLLDKDPTARPRSAATLRALLEALSLGSTARAPADAPEDTTAAPRAKTPPPALSPPGASSPAAARALGTDAHDALALGPQTRGALARPRLGRLGVVVGGLLLTAALLWSRPWASEDAPALGPEPTIARPDTAGPLAALPHSATPAASPAQTSTIAARLDTTALAAPTTAPVPAQTAVPAVRPLVRVSLEATPSARVRMDGRVQGRTPLVLEVASSTRALTLVFDQDGYTPTTRVVVPDQSQRVRVRLAKKGPKLPF